MGEEPLEARPVKLTIFAAASLSEVMDEIAEEFTRESTGAVPGVSMDLILAGSQEYGRWISTALFNPGALFFMAVHVSSNAILFPVFAPLVIRLVDTADGRWGQRWG